MKTNKKFTVKLVFVFFLFYLLSSVSGFAAEKKIGVVDIGKVFDEYEKTKKYDGEFQADGRKKQEERDAIVHEIRKLRDEAALLAEGERGGKQELIDKKMKELDQFDENAQKLLTDKRNEAVKVVFQEIDNTMKQFGERKGYDLIFNERSVLYSNKSYDITQEVLKELNQTYQKQKK
jgi:Skp family chaperone for outer membrane proteins